MLLNRNLIERPGLEWGTLLLENYHLLLTEVKKITGYGVILNTSFNKHGRTVVEEPKDAIIDFLDTNMDYLVIEGILVNRI